MSLRVQKRKEKYKPGTDDSVIYGYEVYGLGTELPKLDEDKMCKTWKLVPSHALIRLFHNTGSGYTDFETGIETGQAIEKLLDGLYMHTDRRLNFTGCLMKKDTLKNKIKLSTVRDFTEKWYEATEPMTGVKTGYPYNCRGYVDCLLSCVFKKPRIWTDKKEKQIESLCQFIKEL